MYSNGKTWNVPVLRNKTSCTFILCQVRVLVVYKKFLEVLTILENTEDCRLCTITYIYSFVMSYLCYHGRSICNIVVVHVVFRIWLFEFSFRSMFYEMTRHWRMFERSRGDAVIRIQLFPQQQNKQYVCVHARTHTFRSTFFTHKHTLSKLG